MGDGLSDVSATVKTAFEHFHKLAERHLPKGASGPLGACLSSPARLPRSWLAARLSEVRLPNLAKIGQHEVSYQSVDPARRADAGAFVSDIVKKVTPLRVRICATLAF